MPWRDCWSDRRKESGPCPRKLRGTNAGGVLRLRRMSELESSAVERLRRRLHAAMESHGGRMPFSRFMALALYAPREGYYEREASHVGRGGDFITSVSVGPLLGEMLGWQLLEWARTDGAKVGEITVVEAGAHAGDLAQDLLTFLRREAGDVFARTNYCIIEPSGVRMEWQRRKLTSFADKVRWMPYADPLKLSVDGMILSNELLDAFPVTRLVWNARRRAWKERGVVTRDDAFAWGIINEIPLEQVESWLGMELPPALLEVLPDGFVLDLALDAALWWRQAALSLRSGILMTLDYGAEADVLISPRYKDGTLRGYLQQRVTDQLLEKAGEVDMTAHVNWTTVRRAGEEAGLKTRFMASQRQYLTQLLAVRMQQPEPLAWTPSQVRQFQSLTHPEHLGRAFQVLVQTR